MVPYVDGEVLFVIGTLVAGVGLGLWYLSQKAISCKYNYLVFKKSTQAEVTKSLVSESLDSNSVSETAESLIQVGDYVYVLPPELENSHSLVNDVPVDWLTTTELPFWAQLFSTTFVEMLSNEFVIVGTLCLALSGIRNPFEPSVLTRFMATRLFNEMVFDIKRPYNSCDTEPMLQEVFSDDAKFKRFSFNLKRYTAVMNDDLLTDDFVRSMLIQAALIDDEKEQQKIVAPLSFYSNGVINRKTLPSKIFVILDDWRNGVSPLDLNQEKPLTS